MTNSRSTLDTKSMKNQLGISRKQRQNEIIKMLDKKTIKEKNLKKHTHMKVKTSVFVVFKTELKSTQNMHNNILF